MSDTNTNPEQTQDTPAPEEKQYSQIELEAIDQGWIPREEFDGDESKFIDAPEFVRRGELFKKIEHTSRELKAVRQALEAFKIHHSKVKEAEYSRALKTLQDARKQAFVEGEHERAFALEEKIDEIRAEKDAVVRDATAPIQEDTNEYTQEFQSWVSRNDWYETNRVMRKTADALGIDLHKEGYSPQEVLKMVEKEIRAEFPHKFKTPANRPMAVEPSSRSGGKSDAFAMDATEREMMRKIVATGIMSEAEYIKDLKATRNK